MTGKTPALFQGKDTDTNTKAVIRQAIAGLQPFDVTLVNYKKNGIPYRCHIEAFPVFNYRSKPVHFIAFESVVEI